MERLCPPNLRPERVECEVEPQDVDARLADETAEAALGFALSQRADTLLSQTARLGDTGGLEQGIGRADMRVEAASRGGDGIGRHRTGPAVFPEASDIAFH